MFGVVVSLIYLETQALLVVPIVCRMINNGVILIYSLVLRGIESVISDFDPPTTDQLKDETWLVMLLIVISVPFLVRFVRARWPTRESQPRLFEAPATD